MRISISNIAWDRSIDSKVAELLRAHGIDAIDVAPSKYFSEPAKVTHQEVRVVASYWQQKGVDIIGMQALLFGTQGLNIFGSADSQIEMLHHLGHVFRIGQDLGAKYLVFGSPKNRDRTGIAADQVKKIAVDFFRRAGDLAAKAGVYLCLEPNATIYGCNFMTTTAETLRIVSAVNHAHIRLQVDLGTSTLAAESLGQSLEGFEEAVGHIHLSEPELAVLGTKGTDHKAFGLLLHEKFSHKPVTIEMRSLSTSREQLEAIQSAIVCARHHYGKESE